MTEHGTPKIRATVRFCLGPFSLTIKLHLKSHIRQSRPQIETWTNNNDGVHWELTAIINFEFEPLATQKSLLGKCAIG